MASNRTGLGIAQLLRRVRAHDAEGQTDGQLLRQFIAGHDEAMFVALVQRHGAMVLGVCRRVLRNEAEVEDAFQATFLVLVRKAGSLSSRAVLGDWLHGVARRTALNAKRLAARRRAKERAMARPEAQGEGDRDDWLPLLDEELSRLADKYRLPIVLCDLEGRTRREAAEQLGWPEGTVAGRLARGRVLLAKQLSRHGLAPSAGSLAAVFSARSATASVPKSLAVSTAKAASLLAAGQATAVAVSTSVVSLTERVVRDILVAKLKFATILVLVLAGLGGGATFVHRALAGEQSCRRSDSAPEGKLSDGEGDKPVMGKESIVWGEAINGLRAGLSYQGKKRPYHVGERVSFVFTLANVSDKTIQIAYHKNPFFDGGNPTVLDATGEAARMLHLTIHVPSGPIVRVTLAPGMTTELGQPYFVIKPADWAAEEVEETTLCAAPGRYKVRQKFFLKGQEADEWTGELTSGGVELEVAVADPSEKKAEAPEPDAKSGAATDEDPALNRLVRSLGEGPIRVRPAAHGAAAVSEEQAVKAAKRAVGVDAPPEKAWRVAVNDREFMSGLLDDKPCWLLYYPGAVQLPLSFEGKDARTLGLYVAVDAGTGRLWEAFTEPETPWWKRVRAKNEDIVGAYAGRGDEAVANPDSPGVSLLGLLNARAQAIPGLPNGQEYEAQRKAQQVVARHFLYTTPVDTEEQTDKGVRRLRSHEREPVWTIEFEGVDLPPPVGPPGPNTDPTPDGPKAEKQRQPNVERIEVMWDATGGRRLSDGMSP